MLNTKSNDPVPHKHITMYVYYTYIGFIVFRGEEGGYYFLYKKYTKRTHAPQFVNPIYIMYMWCTTHTRLYGWGTLQLFITHTQTYNTYTHIRCFTHWFLVECAAVFCLVCVSCPFLNSMCHHHQPPRFKYIVHFKCIVYT